MTATPATSETAAVRSRPRSRAVDTVSRGEAVRFDRAERWLHWANATLVLVLIATGSVMYFGPLSGLLGGRTTVEAVHLWCGLALPVPFAAVVAGRWRRGFRSDVRRLGRFLPDDFRWLRRRRHRPASIRVGKFNAGQKLNAILVAGALPVMLVTGAMLKWHEPFSDPIRTGATFVHDWGFLLLGLLVVGHIRKALQDPTTLRAMRTGRVPLGWARDHHPRWHAELLDVPDVILPPIEGAPSADGTDRSDGPLR